VCDQGWDDKAATVACRMLDSSFTNGLATKNSFFGDVSSNFTLTDVTCVGSEISLLNCTGACSTDCGPKDGAGVICQVLTTTTTTTTTTTITTTATTTTTTTTATTTTKTTTVARQTPPTSLLGQTRIILSWPDQPNDLDLYVWGISNGTLCQISYRNKTACPHAVLDIDNTNEGFNGPETVTLNSSFISDYTYAIAVTSNRGDNTTFGNSQAKVEVTNETISRNCSACSYSKTLVNLPTTERWWWWFVGCVSVTPNNIITFIPAPDGSSFSNEAVALCNITVPNGGLDLRKNQKEATTPKPLLYLLSHCPATTTTATTTTLTTTTTTSTTQTPIKTTIKRTTTTATTTTATTTTTTTETTTKTTTTTKIITFSTKSTTTSISTSTTATTTTTTTTSTTTLSTTTSTKTSTTITTTTATNITRECKCGQRENRVLKSKIKKTNQGKLIGGKVADLKWMALLYLKEDSPDYSCTGVLINSKFILTVLHCVVEDYTKEIAEMEIKNFSHVLLGAAKLGKRNKKKRRGRRGIKRNIANITLHEEGADLALVELSSEVPIQIFTPICLPKTGRPYSVPQKSGHMASFGNKAGTGPGKTLKELSVSITKSCYIPSQDRNTEEDFFCFGGEEGRGGCKGDSGGPIMVETTYPDRSERSTLAGIIAGGVLEQCATAGAYGLAVDVYKWSDWIDYHAAAGQYCKA